MNENQDQDFVVHIKGKNKRKSYDHPPKKVQGLKKNNKAKKEFSNYECFTCHKMGHISKNCPILREKQLMKKNKIFLAHVVEGNDQEYEERTKEDEDSCEEYAFISAVIGSLSPRNGTWLIYSGSSKYMTGYNYSLSCLV